MVTLRAVAKPCVATNEAGCTVMLRGATVVSTALALQTVPPEFDTRTWYVPPSATVTLAIVRLDAVAPLMALPSRNHW